jgi:hypothetical protein
LEVLSGSVRSVVWSHKRDVAEAVERDTGVVDAGFVTRVIWELLQAVREIAEVGCWTRIGVAARIVRVHVQADDGSLTSCKTLIRER